MPVSAESYEQVPVESRAQWREWLRAHHDSAPGVWVVTWKKSSSGPYVSYEDLVEEALCFGWIDTKGRRLDDQRSQLLLTPRRARSGWSRPNKQRVERLIAAGLMEPAGLAVIEAAQRSGTWTALDDVEDGIEPPDLAAAPDAAPDARRQWDAFPRSARRAILEWISSARTAPTRDKRVRTTVEEAAEGRRANQWPRTAGGGAPG